jgi:nucleotide-binding universal stress UspA family protein
MKIANTGSECANPGAKRILVPLDVEKCPIEVFERVNVYAQEPGVTIILLYVITLNIASPENRIYDEMIHEAQGLLERLARDYIRPPATVLVRVRIGRPAREIRVEAEAQRADLVVLPVFERSIQNRGGSLGKRLLASLRPDTTHHLVRVLPSPLLIMHAHSRFNCIEHWGHPNRQSACKPSACGIAHPGLAPGFWRGAAHPSDERTTGKSIGRAGPKGAFERNPSTWRIGMDKGR